MHLIEFGLIPIFDRRVHIDTPEVCSIVTAKEQEAGTSSLRYRIAMHLLNVS